VIPPHLLLQVPGCTDGRPPLAVSLLPGGAGRNRVLRIDTSEGRFVLRQRVAPIDRPGSVARTELVAHQLAASAALAPAIIAAAADASWILMQHVAAPHWSAAELCSAQGIARLGGRLLQLYALPVPPQLPAADPVAMARGYVELVVCRDPRAGATLRTFVDRIQQLTAQLGDSTPRALAHGDLMASNLLGPQPLLVDWEYAQAARPGWDLACLLTYYPVLEPGLAGLLASTGLDQGSGWERFGLERERFALLNLLWGHAYPAGG
jgi:aminoglycoside phosphotransferase (APT) family kinase protein